MVKQGKLQPLQYFAKVHGKGDEAWDVQEPLSQLVNCDFFQTRPIILSHKKKVQMENTVFCASLNREV